MSDENPSFSWYYKEWRDEWGGEVGEVKMPARSKATSPRCRSRSRSRRVGEGRKRLGCDESFPKEVVKADIDSRAKKVAYTLVEFWTDLKMIWNFIFECFREKNDQRQNILRKRQLWIKKCKCIMKQWRQETTNRMLRGKSSIPIFQAERNNVRKGEQREVRQYVLRSGYDYTLEVGPRIGPKKTSNSRTAESRMYGGPKLQGGNKSRTSGQIADIPKMTTSSSRWQKVGKRRKASGSEKEARCSLCLATGGHLARCSGCRRIR